MARFGIWTVAAVCALIGSHSFLPARAVQARAQPAPKPAIKTPMRIASVKLAGFDMQSPGAKPAPLSIELGLADSARGVTRNEDDPTTGGQLAGRFCRWNPAGGMGFYADTAYTSNGARRDIFILVEYLDDASSNSVLALGYMAANASSSGGYHMVKGPAFTGSGAWRKYQFHVTDAKWDRRPSFHSSNPASDFWFSVKPEGYFHTAR